MRMIVNTYIIIDSIHPQLSGMAGLAATIDLESNCRKSVFVYLKKHFDVNKYF